MIGPVWIAGGTTEGRKLAGYAARFRVRAYVSVATEYGASLLPVSPYVTVLEGRMDEGDMEVFLRDKGIRLAVDATHPYATVVTDNIKAACQKAGVPYRRINRRAGTYRTDGRTIAVRTVDEAVEVLSHTEGPVFLTTGSKNLDAFAQIPDYENRVYARILPVKASLERALDLGYPPARLICMQGPFSTDLNEAMFKETGARYVVTKIQVIPAASRRNWRRPNERGRRSSSSNADREIISSGKGLYMHIYVIGTGPGNPALLTVDAKRAIEASTLLVGDKRMLEPFEGTGKELIRTYRRDEICRLASSRTETDGPMAVLVSGDVGFFSLAALLKDIPGCTVTRLAGISSLVYLPPPWKRLGTTYSSSAVTAERNRSFPPFASMLRSSSSPAAANRRHLCAAASVTPVSEPYGLPSAAICLMTTKSSFAVRLLTLRKEGTTP